MAQYAISCKSIGKGRRPTPREADTLRAWLVPAVSDNIEGEMRDELNTLTMLDFRVESDFGAVP